VAVNFLARRAGGDATSPLARIRSLATIWNADFARRRLTRVSPGFNGMIGVTLAGTTYKARYPAARSGYGGEQSTVPLAAQSATPC
jgi:hypothetical protein